jgi:hypothetical protein
VKIVSTPLHIALALGMFVVLGSLALNAEAKKDTPVPADAQCDFVNYHHNEAKNAKGPGKCASDCDCDGMRSCESGTCTGKARPEKLTPAICNSEDYHYQEAWTPAGPGKCASDCDCDGQRTCASGQCTGVARGAAAQTDTPVPADAQCDFVNYHHNEAKNTKGPGKCASDCDCDGMRSCVSGACTGKARPESPTPAICNSTDYHYRESWTPAGSGKCSTDCECDGQRTCVSGTCAGKAR